jgi:indolepyruvate ferredoxin oxidoreductase beta subunit
MKTCNIVFAGVGGQGILLAAEIVGAAAVKAGYNVRVSELHGMAQRGGAVVSHVRIGEKALAPTVLDGGADIILGFEPMEALRNIQFASQRTLVLVNTAPTSITGVKYPDVKEILERIHGFTENVVSFDAAGLAEKAGTVIVQNIVMVGALAATGKLPLRADVLKEALGELVPAKHADVNVKAFEMGYNTVKSTTRSK